jgi:predicted nucleic acid-binding protein
MIILDTNVVSKIMRATSDVVVTGWLDRLERVLVWTTAITVLEVRTGIELLPPSSRRAGLAEDFERFLSVLIDGRVMGFDMGAAIAAARLTADRKRSGRPVEVRDTMIAGIAVANGATVATRNTRHFADLSVPVINPWTIG